MKQRQNYYECILDCDVKKLREIDTLLEPVLVLGCLAISGKATKSNPDPKIKSVGLTVGAFQQSNLIPLIRSRFVQVKSTRIRPISDVGTMSDLIELSNCIRVLWRDLL